MMTLRFRQFADLVRERQRRAKVRKFEFAFQMMFVHQVPLRRQLASEARQLTALQRRYAPFARDTFLLRKVTHNLPFNVSV